MGKGLPLRETFGFLLAEDRFDDVVETGGGRYREANFRSLLVALRIVEQEETDPNGISQSCLAFLVDPANAHKWCMFEKAVFVLLGDKIAGSETREQLAQSIRGYIDPLLAVIRKGMDPPFDDFMRFA